MYYRAEHYCCGSSKLTRDHELLQDDQSQHSQGLEKQNVISETLYACILNYCIYRALDWLVGFSKQKESKQNAIAEVLDAQLLTNCQKLKYLFDYNAVFPSLE